MNIRIRSLARWALLALVVFLVGGQFVPLDRSNPPVDPQNDIVARLAPPTPVKAAFARSCRDCHSNATTWPWYSHVAPVSWVVVDDVKSGRRHLNLSEWGLYDKARTAEKLRAICEEVRSGDMPDFKYTLIHRSARLSGAEVQAICDWTTAERQRIVAEPPRQR